VAPSAYGGLQLSANLQEKPMAIWFAEVVSRHVDRSHKTIHHKYGAEQLQSVYCIDLIGLMHRIWREEHLQRVKKNKNMKNEDQER
jgi:hypothetical protein